MGKHIVDKDIKANGRGVNVIEASIYYSLGGINYFTCRNEPRGYYFSLTPCEKGGGWRRYTAFSGVKTCVLECSRQSKKREQEAAAMLDGLIAHYLGWFCEENGIELVA